MRIIVRATAAQKEEWQQKPLAEAVNIQFIDAENSVLTGAGADVFFDLALDETNPVFIETTNPVFVNAVILTLAELPENYIRINTWNGFLKRGLMEVAASEINKPIVQTVMDLLGWKYVLVPDIPGMIAARSISMIINEAYYTLGDEVSTKEAINIAMKLGTNYPFGPFEWSEKIGLGHIYLLLKKMNKLESRYTIAPLLKQEALQTITNKQQ